jgi:hypothetical protein
MGDGVLDEERHAAEGPLEQVAVGGGAGFVGQAVDDGVQLAVEVVDPGDGGVDQLGRRRLAAPDQLCLRRGVEPGRVVVAAHAALNRAGRC